MGVYGGAQPFEYGPEGPQSPTERASERFFGKDIFFEEDFDVTPAGDFLTVQGKKNLTRAIIRRLIVRPGEYVFRPTYGVGLPSFVKETTNTATLDELRNRITANLNQEERIQQVLETQIERTDINGKEALLVFLRIRVGGEEIRITPPPFTEQVI